MIRKVTIENYALIDSLEIEFGKGLNTITGETGAGKSLLLGALSLIQGGRSDSSLLRDPSRPCVVETEFDLAGYDLRSAFDKYDIDYDDTAWFRRVISPAGKSRAFINDVPVTLQAMKELSGRILDIHSQHQTLMLGSNKFQTDLVDSVAGHGELLARYRRVFSDWKSSETELSELLRKADDERRNEDFLRFQLDQLRQAALKEGEAETLESEINELSHASEIKETLFRAETAFTEEENGILPRLKALLNSLGRTDGFFQKAGEFSERLRSVYEELKDIAYGMSEESDRMLDDPARLSALETRLDLLNTLMQKHRTPDLTALIRLRDRTEEELARIGNYEENIAAARHTAETRKKEAAALAAELTAGRTAAVPEIERFIRTETRLLGMPNVQFRVEILPAEEMTPAGRDRIRFLFTANKSTSLLPLEQVASGGELSRLMLCLKSLVARHRKLPAILFDEIDSGISGDVADKMGTIIERLSDHLQVINITHLPQVASKGRHHYHVYKEDTAEATNTRIRRLDDQERVEEIAKMLSGSTVTAPALQQARTLLEK